MRQVVGFTQGVFDMFHVGHLNLLNNARALCDRLIVGVNSDELVRQYKDKRAIVPYEERALIVSAIKGVDAVLRADTLDKEVLWRQQPFDVIFIGDDWRGHPRWLATEEAMATHGVKVVYLPYTQGPASTLLREKLMEY